jgi:hypothetical protein
MLEQAARECLRWKKHSAAGRARFVARKPGALLAGADAEKGTSEEAALKHVNAQISHANSSRRNFRLAAFYWSQPARIEQV